MSIKAKLYDLIYFLSHVSFGFICSVSVVISPVLSVLTFLIFLVYELNQDWRLGDYSYQEFREFGLGFALGVVIMLISYINNIFIGE